jgi:hypothetical protein
MSEHGSTSAFPPAPVELSVDGWRTATRCGPNGGNCVEVNRASGAEIVGVRDTKPAHSPVLAFGAEGWRSFLTAAASGGLRA